MIWKYMILWSFINFGTDQLFDDEFLPLEDSLIILLSWLLKWKYQVYVTRNVDMKLCLFMEINDHDLAWKYLGAKSGRNHL